MTSQTNALDDLHDDTPAVLAGCPRGNQDALGRPRGVHIGSMNALDLLHRTVLDAYGAAFHVSGLTLNAAPRRCGGILAPVVARLPAWLPGRRRPADGAPGS